MTSAIEGGRQAVSDGTRIASWAEAAAHAESSGAVAHYLVVIDGRRSGARLEVGPTPATIGRAPECDLILDDADVSRRHCMVALRFGELEVTDLGSTNGTLADGKPVHGSAILAQGGLLQVGAEVLRHERRGRRELTLALGDAAGIERASRYVRSLLPAPLVGGPLAIDWVHSPCARLGGDAFGYHRIDERAFAIYLLDVAGHGVEAAMHAVAVINVLRQPSPPEVDPRSPAQVLARLARLFPMEAHGYLFFTLWYGAYDSRAQTLAYASAGHPPAILVAPDRASSRPLRTPNVAVGVDAQARFTADRVEVGSGSRLYLFSDGAFEIATAEGRRWGMADLEPLLREPPVAGVSEPERVYRAVRAAARSGPLDDDFSLLGVRFA